MDPQVWHKVAAISGVAALGLGTYGAHVFKPQNPAYKDVWHTASLYHLVHTAALVAAPITKHPTVFGGLLTTGILAFSGTCYTVALLEDRKYSTLAPFGGFAFIAAWDDLGSLSSLLGLDLSGNNFVRPTYCIKNLHTLKSLTLIDYCPRLESFPMLLPNVQCLCTVNSTPMKPLNSDAYMLWKIFELHMNQVYLLYTPCSLPDLPPIHPNCFHKVCVYQMEDRQHCMFIIPKREIQKWNEECFLVDPSHHPCNMLGCDSVASIIVEAPNYSGSSGWLGIAICLALEPSNMQSSSQSHVSLYSMGNEETAHLLLGM